MSRNVLCSTSNWTDNRADVHIYLEIGLYLCHELLRSFITGDDLIYGHDAVLRNEKSEEDYGTGLAEGIYIAARRFRHVFSVDE